MSFFFQHIMFAANLLFVMITVAPYIYGLQIEPATGRCVNFGGDTNWMSLPYNWFSFLVYSFIPICITSYLAVKLTLHFAKVGRKN